MALKDKFCQKMSVQYVLTYLKNPFCVTRVQKFELLRQMYGSLMILPPSCLYVFESQYMYILKNWT